MKKTNESRDHIVTRMLNYFKSTVSEEGWQQACLEVFRLNIGDTIQLGENTYRLKSKDIDTQQSKLDIVIH